MLDLSRPLIQYVEIKEVEYPLNLAFDNVLRLFELLEDHHVMSWLKGYLALEMLTGHDFIDELNIQEVNSQLELIIKDYIAVKSETEIKRDLEGNIMPVKAMESEEELIISLKYDTDYIYASFLQAYGIDLFQMQGQLHWQKFKALLNGLPEDTQIMKIIGYRKWKPSKHDSKEYKAQMKKLKEAYKLPSIATY